MVLHTEREQMFQCRFVVNMKLVLWLSLADILQRDTLDINYYYVAVLQLNLCTFLRVVIIVVSMLEALHMVVYKCDYYYYYN